MTAEQRPSRRRDGFTHRTTQDPESAFPAFTTSIDENQQFSWLSYLDLLIPVYLSPLLFRESIISKCAYCLLLPLLFWAFDSTPKPAMAMLHVVTLPLLNLFSTDQMAAEYMSIDVLVLALQLSLVVTLETFTNLAPWLAYTGCRHYTAHRRTLFVVICSLTFAGAMLFSNTLISVPLLFFMDRAFSFMFDLGLDTICDISKHVESVSLTSANERESAWERVVAGVLPTEECNMLTSGNQTQAVEAPETSLKFVLAKPVDDSQPPEKIKSNENVDQTEKKQESRVGQSTKMELAPKRPWLSREPKPKNTNTVRPEKEEDSPIEANKIKDNSKERTRHHDKKQHNDPEREEVAEYRKTDGGAPEKEHEPHKSTVTTTEIQMAGPNENARPKDGTDTKACNDARDSRTGQPTVDDTSNEKRNIQALHDVKIAEQDQDASVGKSNVKKPRSKEQKKPRGKSRKQPVDKDPGTVEPVKTLIVDKDKPRAATLAEPKIHEGLPSAASSSVLPSSISTTTTSAKSADVDTTQSTATSQGGSKSGALNQTSESRPSIVPVSSGKTVRMIHESPVKTSPRKPSNVDGEKPSPLKQPQRLTRRTSILRGPNAISRRISAVVFGHNQFQVISIRRDIYQAFMLGPALSAVLGGLCNFWGESAGTIIKTLTATGEFPRGEFSAFSWILLTLPGSLMAMAFVDIYIFWSFVSPHEQHTIPVERTSLRLMTRKKIKNLTSTPGVSCIFSSLMILFTVVYLRLLIVDGIIRRTSVLSALAVGILVSTAISYLSGSTIPVMKELWCRVPWGIIFVFGAVQVISKVFEVHDIISEIFKLVNDDVWKTTSPVPIQALLAIITSVLAEAIDERMLNQLMVPVVRNIATIKNDNPIYYAIPVAVAASSNVVMPSTIPMVVVHELARIQPYSLLYLGLAVKLLLIAMILVTTNVSDLF